MASRSHGKMVLASLTGAALFAGYLSVGPLAGSTQGAANLAAEATDSLALPDFAGFSLWFDQWNHYTEDAPITSYPWAIVEPYRTTTLAARSNVTFDMSSLSWTIEGETLTGQVVQHTFTDVGKQNVTLSVVTPAGHTVSYSESVMCRYVRREMRTLTHSDRVTFLSALHKVYVMDSTEGKAKFGDTFENIEWFSRMHLEGAAAKDCDHWHDGAGLVVHHMSFTLGMEQVLQTVDPMIAMPYWEYSYDAHEYDKAWDTESNMFTASWFGAVHTNRSSEFKITEGRWAYTPMRVNTDHYSPIANPYGLLRSPWNTNPTPYLTRTNQVFEYINAGFDTLPNCMTLDLCFESDTLADMNVCLNGDTHGPVHIMIGGQYHATANQTKVVSDHKATRIQLLVFKALWRMGYAVCPEHCSAETGHTDCVCSCPNTEHNALEILTDKTGLMHFIDSVSDYIYYDKKKGAYNIHGYSANKLQSTWHELLQAFCSPGHVGELYTSNAPADPLFWVIHTAGERLLNYKRILAYKGLADFDETWGYTRPSGVPSDTGFVCDWSVVKPGVQDYPECTVKTCTGHEADDLLPVNLMGKQYSNAEFYEFIHPYNEELPYAYDNFKWEHCTASGVHIGQSSSSSSSSKGSDSKPAKGEAHSGGSAPGGRR